MYCRTLSPICSLSYVLRVGECTAPLMLQFYVGTSVSNVYRFSHVSDFKPQLMSTSHNECINDIAFA